MRSKATSASRLLRQLAALGLLVGSTLAAAAMPHKLQLPKGPPVDINSAPAAQLKKLPGISEEQAERIVAGRPYLSKADLVAQGAIPAGTYLVIKRRIVALQKLPPKGSR